MSKSITRANENAQRDADSESAPARLPRRPIRKDAAYLIGRSCEVAKEQRATNRMSTPTGSSPTLTLVAPPAPTTPSPARATRSHTRAETTTTPATSARARESAQQHHDREQRQRINSRKKLLRKRQQSAVQPQKRHNLKRLQRQKHAERSSYERLAIGAQKRPLLPRVHHQRRNKRRETDSRSLVMVTPQM